MRTKVVGCNVEVDICDRCGCVFLEYFDGEPSALARALSDDPVMSRPTTEVTVHGCADCGGEMRLHPYLGTGPWLYRCHACMGVFATSEMLRELARFAMSSEPQDASGASRSWIQRLLDIFP